MAVQPLSDLTVVDFSHGIAGPYATVLLADHGADVILIEPPDGASQRHMLNGVALPNVDRNKRSVVVDLKREAGARIVDRLVARADVIVHSFSPGTMERLGYDYETVRELDSSVVYCGISGYGGSGPYRSRPGYGPLAQSMSGLMSTTGEPDRKPSRIGASVVDYCTGSHAAVAIMMALWHRNRTGRGEKIEVSLLDVAATFMGFWYTYVDRFDRVPERMGHSWELNAGSGFFETDDGAIYLTFGSTAQWHRLCRELDREGWIEDERFDTLDGRNEHRETLHAMLDEAFAEYTTAEAVELCLDAHVPAAEYHTVPEAAADEHLQSRETVTTVEDVDGDHVQISAHPFRFPDSSLPDLVGPPRPGEDTRAVLTNLGFTTEEIDDFAADKVITTEGEQDE